MRKWCVSYLEMANPSLYVYMHIIFSTLQEVTSDNEAGNVAFDF
jgi:hypothetical protein